MSGGLTILGDTSGSVALVPATVAGSTTITLAANSGTLCVGAPTFRATTATTQSFSINTPTKATCYTTEQWDTNSCYDNSSCRFTPTVAGYYLVSAGIQYGNLSCVPYLYIYKNGGVYTRTNWAGSAVIYGNLAVSGLVYLNGSTDYVEVYIECDGASGSPATYQDTSFNFFSAAWMRGA